MKVPKHITDELIKRAKIPEYVEKYYPKIHFTLSGSWYKGYCPFHEDDTPSFGHYIGSDIFKCFGCGKSGNIFTLVRHMENVSYEEAAKIIGDNVGVDVKLEPPNPYFENYKNTFTEYAKRYHENLLQSEEALDYLTNKSRLTMDTVEEFNLGLTSPEEYKYRSAYPMGNIKDRITFPIYNIREIQEW
jgi:DNA primase